MSIRLKSRMLLAAAATALGSVPAGAQGLDGYAFIEWAADDRVLVPMLADADSIAGLQAAQHSHATRLIEVELHFRADGAIEQFHRSRLCRFGSTRPATA